MKENIIDKLQLLGVDAQIVENKKRPEWKTGFWTLSKYEAVIDIVAGFIKWIRIRSSMGGQGSPTTYRMEYGVPDSRLGPDSPKMHIKTILKKNFPVVGRSVDLRWKGKDYGSGIINRLNSDVSIRPPILNLDNLANKNETLLPWGRGVKILTDNNLKCWIISVQSGTEIERLSEELWTCLQTIAQHLLAERTTAK